MYMAKCFKTVLYPLHLVSKENMNDRKKIDNFCIKYIF